MVAGVIVQMKWLSYLTAGVVMLGSQAWMLRAAEDEKKPPQAENEANKDEGQESEGIEIPSPAPEEKWFSMEAKKFLQSQEATQKIDLLNVDHNLLSAAVFHETNQARQKHDLRPLKYKKEVWQAAALQARAVARGGWISHTQKVKELRTPSKRLEFTGLQPKFAAENVATTFGLQYEGGKPFFTRIEDGQEVYSYEAGGDPIPRHTYASFGEALVESWMNSPGHRKNILSEPPEFLGCSSLQGKDERGMPVFFCAQVFFTPLNIPEGAEVRIVPQ